LKNDFVRIKRTVFLSVVLTTLLWLVVGGLTLLVVVGIFYDSFATIFKHVVAIAFGDSRLAYALFNLFERNRVFFFSLCIFALLLVCFYIGLSRFTRCFREVYDGLDKLVDGAEGEITLSPEMEEIEKKLNTVKRKLEKRAKDAQEAEQRKNDLVVYLAHDVRTPLTSVIGYLSLLNEAGDMPAEQRAKYLNITLDKAFRLEQLVNEFFEITRFNLQSIVLEKEEINLSIMLAQLADEFYPLLAPHGKLAVVNAPNSLVICGDAGKLARVFNNILKNAAAYSDENSTIDIEAKEHEGVTSIAITNRGKPIPQNNLQHIFEKFYRLDSARSTDTGGAGLGLAIAQEIVMAHGGEITVESGAQGTTFTVKLPA